MRNRPSIDKLEAILFGVGFRAESSTRSAHGKLTTGYFRREGRLRFALSRYDEHLFLHSGEDFSGQEALREAHWKERRLVNAGYRVPRALRLTKMPITTTLVLFDAGLPEVIARYTREVAQSHWLGGDIGLLALFDVDSHELTHLRIPRRHSGAAPLAATHDLLTKTLGRWTREAREPA